MASQYLIPPEMWTIIFQIISEEDDIKNVRLTCRIFEELATPLLLPRVICTPLSSSLATLIAVSRHPVFSRSVVEVVYVCNRYRFIKTLREYKEALRREESVYGKFAEPKSGEEALHLKRAFSEYVQAYNDQTTMENSGEVLACLCSALMRMPHIETVTISPNFCCYLEGHCYSRYFLEPDPGYNEAFLLVARALSLTGTKIRVLEIERDDYSRGAEGINGALFRGMSDINLNHCCDAFRGLRSVTIAAEGDDVGGWTTGNLAKILARATCLERLSVYGCYMSFHISTKYTLGTIAWSRLASLEFTYANLDQGDFLHLLTRHSGTLKKIDLFCVCLRNGSWKCLLEGVKSSLSLLHLSIDHPLEEDGGPST